jgi:membrane associated rhomboid family serine protease
MVIPIYDGNPFNFKSPPYVTWALIGVNVAIFIVILSADASGSNSKTSYVLSLAFTPAWISHDNLRADQMIPWEFTLVTYSFLHASWIHILGNMAFLWVFGDDVEAALGHLRFFIFYIMCAIGGALAHLISEPSSNVPLVGASGAIAGIVAAYLMLHPCRKIWVLALMRIPIKLAAEWTLGFWIFLQFLNIMLATSKEVAWWTHIGGLMAGAVLVVVLRQPGVKLFDCAADRLLQKEPRLVDTK